MEGREPGPDATGGGTPSSEPAPPSGNPAAKVGAVFVIVLIALVCWYVISDRMAPYTNRGVVQAYVTQIAPRVAGQVKQIFVEDNIVVEPGQPLFQLDQQPFELAVRIAETALEQAMQGAEVSSAGVAAAQAGVAQARASLGSIEAATGRTRALVKRGVASKAALETSEAQLASAQAQLEGAESSLASAVAQAGGAATSTPAVEAARLQLEQAQTNLLYSTVTAPTRGLVTNLHLAIGQYAGTGTPVLTFIDARGAWVSADLRENQLGNIDAGDEVDLVFDALPGRVLHGKVHSVGWGIDPGRATAGGLMQNQPANQWFEPARRFPVRIELNGGMEAWPPEARAGSKVNVVVYAGGRDTVVGRIAGTLQRLQSYLSYLH